MKMSRKYWSKSLPCVKTSPRRSKMDSLAGHCPLVVRLCVRSGIVGNHCRRAHSWSAPWPRIAFSLSKGSFLRTAPWRRLSSSEPLRDFRAAGVTHGVTPSDSGAGVSHTQGVWSWCWRVGTVPGGCPAEGLRCLRCFRPPLRPCRSAQEGSFCLWFPILKHDSTSDQIRLALLMWCTLKSLHPDFLWILKLSFLRFPPSALHGSSRCLLGSPAVCWALFTKIRSWKTKANCWHIADFLCKLASCCYPWSSGIQTFVFNKGR